MADDLSVAVERLRTSTQRLNEISDAANELFRDVEQFLDKSQVGISASVSLGFGADSHDATEPDWEEFLSYRRVSGGKFRILIGRNYIGSPDGEILRPWSECSREDKFEGLAKLPELLIELAKIVETRTIEAEKTITNVGSRIRLPKSKKGG